ncbi:MAG TPA: class D sortase [Chloroflexi bacterium]|nr:class D sortase [Chloroflexota bacterium]
MKDHRYVDELSIEELERILRIRRRQERLRRLGNRPMASDPLTQVPSDGRGVENESVLERSLPDSVAVSQASAVFEARRQRRPIKWRWVWDRFLLLVEVLAVVGLLLVFAQLLSTISLMNEESREAQIVPTATVTPIVNVMILPSGHTPPDAFQRSEPAPIPLHLRGLIAEITPLPVPTQGPEHARRIRIPAIGVDAPVVEGDDWESLKKGAGHHVGSANPGERGNCVISAHNDIYGEIFRDLPELSIGDEILVETFTKTYRYVVEQTRIVEPTETSVMATTSSPVLTLISCYPYRINTHRIVVIASLVRE